MAKFFVGQRVRVRCEGSLSDGEECTITRLDIVSEDYGRPYVGHEVDIPEEFFGGLCVFESHELEPILDRHEPCESDFKESLDKLLSEVSREAVE